MSNNYNVYARIFNLCLGIHLCEIENSMAKQDEAWQNINAINDVINTVAEMRNKTVVAVLRGNAGAGGAMMAAACDITIAHPVLKCLTIV